MSDVVNEETSGEPIGRGAADSGAMGENLDIGAIAAEFVLGTLDSEEARPGQRAAGVRPSLPGHGPGLGAPPR